MCLVLMEHMEQTKSCLPQIYGEFLLFKVIMAKIQRESLPNKIEALLSEGGQQKAPPCCREKTKGRHKVSFSPGTGIFSPQHPMDEKINIWSSRKLMCPWGFEINLHCRRDLPPCGKSLRSLQPVPSTLQPSCLNQLTLFLKQSFQHVIAMRPCLLL